MARQTNNEDPRLDCINITSSTDYQSSISTTITINPSVTDNVDNNLTATCSHTSDDSFPLGDTVVICNATDSSGNHGHCSFIVTIIGIGDDPKTTSGAATLSATLAASAADTTTTHTLATTESAKTGLANTHLATTHPPTTPTTHPPSTNQTTTQSAATDPVTTHLDNSNTPTTDPVTTHLDNPDTPTTDPVTTLLDITNQPAMHQRETHSSTTYSFFQKNVSSHDDPNIVFNSELYEEKIFEIGLNLSSGKSIILDDITYVNKRAVEDLCASEWNITWKGNQFSLPSKYFCSRSNQYSDGEGDTQDAVIGITSSSHVAQLYNNKSATYDKEGVNLRVASDIITAVVFIGDDLLSIPCSFVLKHSQMIGERFSSPTCRFWDHDKRNWNSSGCQEISTDDVNVTSCYCDHMTSFAVIVSLMPSELEEDFVSDILTWIGLGLSIGSLIISLLIFFIVRHSLTADRVIIHVNLMIAILFANITFLSGINPIEVEHACKAYSFILHYFYLAVVFWMLVEGVHLYRQIIQVFHTGNPRTWVYGIIGWGAPVVVLIISGAVKHRSYGYERSCWLNPTDGTIWAFSGPAIGIVLVNLVILLMVVKAVVSASRGQLENDKIVQIKAGLRSTLLLLPLLGIPWLLTPLVAAFGYAKALEYAYIMLNTLQGFFVALIYCFTNSEVRNAIGESIRKARESHALESNASKRSTADENTTKAGLRMSRVAPAPSLPSGEQTGAF